MLGTALALWYWASFAFLQKCKQMPSCIHHKSHFIQYGHILFKGTVSRDFLLLVLFMKQFPPQPQSIPLRPFWIFSKIRGAIRSSRFATGVVDTGGKPWKMEKIFNQKSFNNFIWSPLGSRGNIYINSCLQVHFQVSAAWYCSNYLPPVSMTPICWHRRQICRRYRWHRWQICHRCQQHKGNWWQNLSPVSLIPVANLPPVSLILAKFATSVIDTSGAPWLANISANFWKDPNVIIRGLGEVIHEKNLKQKISWHCPCMGVVV